MTKIIHHKYTNEPELQPQLILSSLQLLVWLLFHPTAWRSHALRLDPKLSPEFSLITLKRTDWANPILHRLLLIGYVVWPLLVGISTGLTLWAFGESRATIAYRVGLGVAFFIIIEGGLGVIGSFTYGLISGLVSGMVISLTGNLVAGIVAGLGIGVLRAVRVGWLSTLLYPLLLTWNTLLYYAEQRQADDSPSLLPWHSAFWDEYQRLPLFGLAEHLVLIAERRPAEGQAAIDYLATGHQRQAAQAAQIELDARQLEKCANIEAISQVHLDLVMSELTGPANNLLRLFGRHSQDIQTALNYDSSYYQRRELSNVEKPLSDLQRELTLSDEPYAVRFYSVATNWYQIIADHLAALNKAAESKNEIINPYVVGIPLTVQQEIFVGRVDIAARIEQLLLDQQRPPLLLYGQRRMGKTSLLYNLGRLLPSTIIPLYVDTETISSASDYSDFLYYLVKEITRSARLLNLTLPGLSRADLSVNPFTGFNEWLDTIEQTLTRQGYKMALLTLDEFEALADVRDKGRFDEYDVLRMLRHLIQHRPHFKLLLSGSHTLDEFRHWAGYLINVQVIKINYLEEDETRQLIERPVKNFALQYEPRAVQRILELTHGHPALTQLLCHEIVMLKNKQEPTLRRLVCVEDVETAVPKALTHGKMLVIDIKTNQIDATGRKLLDFLAAQGERAIADADAMINDVEFSENVEESLAKLMQLDLIESVNGGYRFQVELIRRWFAQDGG